MKKNRNFNLKALLLLCLVIFSNCSNDENILEPIEGDILIETLSIDDAKDLFQDINSSSSLFSKSSGKPFVTPHLDEINQEAIENSEELITLIPSTTSLGENQNSRIVLLKIDGEIKSVVFNMIGTDQEDNEDFTGNIIVTELDGTFLNGYRVDKGQTVALLAKSESSKTNAKSNLLAKSNNNCPYSDPFWCSYYNSNRLSEVTITVALPSNNNSSYSSTYNRDFNTINILNLYSNNNSYNHYNTTNYSNYSYSWNYGGRGGSSISSSSSISTTLINTLNNSSNSSGNALTASQKSWISNYSNRSKVTSLNNYLKQNQYSSNAYEQAKEFIYWEINFRMLPTVPCGFNHDCVKSIRTMAEGLRRFHGEDGKLMADYFDSLVEDFGTFTRDDLQVFYDTAVEITRQYNARMRNAIIFGFAEGVTPIVEIALFEVGGTVAIKLLQKIPVSWVYRGARLNNMVKEVGLLGKQGYTNSIREVITNTPVTKAKELFNTLTRHKIGNLIPEANGVLKANMGNGNFITYRPITASSSNIPATISLDFRAAGIWTKVRDVKFMAP